MQSRIVCLEEKAGSTGPARIVRVTFSMSGRTLRHADLELRSLEGRGFQANCFDVRGLPEQAHVTSFRSPGKHSSRRPRPELAVMGSVAVGCTRRAPVRRPARSA